MQKIELPACGAPATNRFELFSPANGRLCGTLDGVVRTCDEHAAAARAAAEEAGMSAWTVHGVDNLGTCGRVTDYDALLGKAEPPRVEERAGECLGCGSLVIRPVGEELWCSWCRAEG